MDGTIVGKDKEESRHTIWRPDQDALCRKGEFVQRQRRETTVGNNEESTIAWRRRRVFFLGNNDVATAKRRGSE